MEMLRIGLNEAVVAVTQSGERIRGAGRVASGARGTGRASRGLLRHQERGGERTEQNGG